MINKNMFRAYDIRGLHPEDLHEDTARLVGLGFGTYLQRDKALKSPTVVVGRDNRTHGEMLQQAFIAGLVSTGCRVTDVGLSPSPMLYFANSAGQFDAGCNVTASHNPADYNGFKLITKNGHAVFGDELQKVYQLIMAGHFEMGEGTLAKASFFEDYLKKLHSMFVFGRPLKIVVDTGNGVAGAFYPKVLKALGHEVTELYTELDGTFPNHEPDPVVEKNLTDLKALVLKEQADLGLAFDGDGDRVSVVTEAGQFVNADKTLMLLAEDALSRSPGRSIVFTVSNSQALFDLVTKWNGHPVMCKVGHSYVEDAMTEHRAILGGEQSGHFFLPEDYYPFDDALVTACRILSIASHGDRPVSALMDRYPKSFALPEMRPYCADNVKFDVLARIRSFFEGKYPAVTLDGIRLDFGRGAWAGIRVSNTSPCLSVTMEAQSQAHLDDIQRVVMEHLRTYPEIDWNKA